MKTTVRKWFWVWDFEKEEQWLNQMADKGLVLVDVGFGKYLFEEDTPGAYSIRLEMLDNAPSHGGSQEYIRFIEETGAEYIGSYLRWIYFKKKKTDGTFALHSDVRSRIKLLNRILALTAVLSIVNLFHGANSMVLYITMRISVVNLVLGLICTAVGLLIGYGALLVNSKKQHLKKEAQLYEI